jgi:hypothetical protein
MAEPTKELPPEAAISNNDYIVEVLFLLNLLFARMAELVDALVSNTSGSNAVPVRSRLRVQKTE